MAFEMNCVLTINAYHGLYDPAKTVATSSIFHTFTFRVLFPFSISDVAHLSETLLGYHSPLACFLTIVLS